GGAAGAPSLSCVVKDTDISYTSAAFTLAPQASKTLGPIEFTIPVANFNDDNFVNHASVDCTYPGLTTVVASNTSQHTTNLFQPSVDVQKTGPAYSKVGETVTYHVVITNTSSADSPALKFDSISDTKVASLTTVPAACQTLAYGASCNFDYTYVVQAGDDSGLAG